MNNFYDRFRVACAERGVTMSKVLRDLGKATSSVAVWKNGKYPQLDTAMQIAQYLNISLDELCYGTKGSNNTSTPSSIPTISVKGTRGSLKKLRRPKITVAKQSDLLTKNGQEWFSLISKIPADHQAPLKELLRSITKVDTTSDN